MSQRSNDGSHHGSQSEVEDEGGWFETVESEVRYEGDLSRIRVDRVRTPLGRVVEREIVEHDDAVAVVPITDDGQVVMLRQYRQPFSDYQLEIPAGKLDVAGEPLEEAAQRELLEETGLRAGRLERIGAFRNSSGWTDEVTYLYVGTGLRYEGQPEDFTPKGEEADMEVLTLPLAEAVAQAHAGTIVDAKTIIGLLLAAQHVDQRPDPAP